MLNKKLHHFSVPAGAGKMQNGRVRPFRLPIPRFPGISRCAVLQQVLSCLELMVTTGVDERFINSMALINSRLHHFLQTIDPARSGNRWKIIYNGTALQQQSYDIGIVPIDRFCQG